MASEKLKIDWDKVDRYLQAQCSGVAIASILGIHENTLYERCKTDRGMAFVEYAMLKKGEGKELLRAKMFNEAMAGSNTMQIWLSKQYLGMADKSDINQKMSFSDYVRERKEKEAAEAEEQQQHEQQ